MTTYKIVNSEQLDSDLSVVANAIREIGGTTAALSFPEGMKQAIEAIKSGGSYSVIPAGTYKAKNPSNPPYLTPSFHSTLPEGYTASANISGSTYLIDTQSEVVFDKVEMYYRYESMNLGFYLGDAYLGHQHLYDGGYYNITIPDDTEVDPLFYAIFMELYAKVVKIHISEFDSTYPLRFMYGGGGSIHTETVDSSKIGTDIYLPCDVMFFAEVNDQSYDPYGNGLFYHADGRMIQVGEYQKTATYYDGQVVGMFISTGLTADTYYLKLM